jgi:hypothetical protein
VGSELVKGETSKATKVMISEGVGGRLVGVHIQVVEKVSTMSGQDIIRQA